MKQIILIATLLAGLNVSGAPVCSKFCNPDKSKPCGNACIAKDVMCRKPWTTACVGTASAKTKVSYANPKHVDKAP